MTDFAACQTSDCRVSVFEGTRCPSCDVAGVRVARIGPNKWEHRVTESP